MQSKSLFGEGKWYKGNTHAHTNLSDGSLPADQLIGIYRECGYDFTALTDHRVYGVHAELSDDSFLVLPGIELDVPVSDEKAFCHHVVGLGLPGQNKFIHGEKIEYSPQSTVADILKILSDNGNLAIYAHPAWSHIHHEILDSIDGFVGMEIYNHTCEVNSACGNSESYYDRLLWKKRNVWCLASDDTHQHKPDWNGGFIMVRADQLSHKAILDAILQGSFYASQGPMIEEFYIANGKATVRCSNCAKVGFLADSFPGATVLDESGQLTEAEYVLSHNERYLRVVCVDLAGRRAWTQPIWL